MKFEMRRLFNPVATTWSITCDHILQNEYFFLAAEVLSTINVLDTQAILESLLDGGMQKLKFTKAVQRGS